MENPKWQYILKEAAQFSQKGIVVTVKIHHSYLCHREHS